VYQEGQPRRLGLQTGDRVRIPDPHGGGKVKAVVVTPAEPGRKVRIAWVRLLEGPEAGELARVDCSYMEPASKSGVDEPDQITATPIEIENRLHAACDELALSLGGAFRSRQGPAGEWAAWIDGDGRSQVGTGRTKAQAMSELLARFR